MKTPTSSKRKLRICLQELKVLIFVSLSIFILWLNFSRATTSAQDKEEPRSPAPIEEFNLELLPQDLPATKENIIVPLKEELYATYGIYSTYDDTVTLPDGTIFYIIDPPEYEDGEELVLILRGDDTPDLADDLLIYIE